MKKGLYAILAILCVLLAVFVVFFVLEKGNTTAMTKKVKELENTVSDDASKIETLSADAAAKDSQIEALTAELAEQNAQIEEFSGFQSLLELKQVLAEHYIGSVDEAGLMNAAAASMVAGLGDSWSYFMTADEYKAYQLSAANDDADMSASSAKGGAVDYRLEKTGAAYVQIRNFEAGSGQAAVDAIEDLLGQGADSLVIDLRDNAGGLPSEAAVLLDYLLPAGRLFSERDGQGVVTVAESDICDLQMPTCVLVSSGTSGEAELFAAVLKEWGWATLLGEPTNGNTRSQEIFPLSNGSALCLSTKAYLTPGGTDISAQGGLVPDYIVFNYDSSATGVGEGADGISEDVQLMAALRLLH